MAAENVLEQFVVALGFKTDEAAAKKMTANLEAVAVNVAGITAALGAVALAASAAVAKIASTFNTLYYESGRVKSSVENLQAMQFAFKQTGGSAQQATSAIEAYARAIRTNPGVGQFVKDLGVDTKADTWDQVIAVVEKLKDKPYYVGQQYAEMLGIDENTYKLMTDQIANLKAYRTEYERTTKRFGLNTKDAADASNRLMHVLGSLSMNATVFSQALLVKLIPAIEGVVSGILRWIDTHPEVIARIMTAIATAADLVSKAFSFLMAALTPVFEYLSDKAAALNKDGGFLKTWEKVASVFERVENAIRSVLGWLNQLDRATDMSKGLRQLGRFLGFIEGKTADFTRGGVFAAGALDGATDAGVGSSGGKPNLLQRTWDAAKRMVGLGGGGGPVKPLGPVARNGNAQTIIRTLREAGYGENAIAAVVGSMQTESSFNPRAANSVAGGHTGLWQWDRNRWPRIERWIKSQGGDPYDAGWQTKAWMAEHNAKPGDPMYDHRRTQRGGEILRSNPSMEDAIHGVRESERFGPGEEGGRAARARQWLPQVRQGSAAPAASVYSMPKGFNPGSFDVNRLGASPMGSFSTSTDNSRSVTQNSPVTINMTMSGDPASNASFVERSMNRVNNRALANMQSAVR